MVIAALIAAFIAVFTNAQSQRATNDLDPKLTAAALGMRDSGLVRYLADNVAHDRLHRTMPR